MNLKNMGLPFILIFIFLLFFLTPPAALRATSEVLQIFVLNPMQTNGNADLERFNRALPRLLQHEILHSATSTHDAGPVLNPKIPWFNDPSAGSNDSRHKLPKEFETVLHKPEGQWLEGYGTGLLDNKGTVPDFSFLLNLEKYDYWEFATDSPLGKYIKDNYTSPHSFPPAPDLVYVEDLVKVQLILGLKAGTLSQTASQVAKLARLLLTTERGMGALIAFQILNDIHETVIFSVEKHLPVSPSIPDIMNVASIDLAKNLLATYQGLINPFMSADFIHRLSTQPHWSILQCIGLNEGLFFTERLRPFLEPHLPFETDFRPQYAALDNVLRESKSHCRMSFADSFWDIDGLALQIPFPSHLPVIPTSRPYLRRLEGLFQMGNFIQQRRGY